MKSKLPFRLTTGLFLTSLLVSTRSPASAESLSNENYIIDSKIIQNQAPVTNQISKTPKKTSNLIKDNNTTSDISQRIRSEYERQIRTYFTFSGSTAAIDYGTIVPGEPILRNLNLSLQAPLHHGFTVYMYQDTPLSTTDNNQIPNTTCDDGACTIMAASAWKSPLTFGLGYRCSSNGSILCHQDFIQSDFYKPVPTSTTSATPILKSFKPAINTESVITYKVNVPGTQAVKSYNNNFTFLLIPHL